MGRPTALLPPPAGFWRRAAAFADRLDAGPGRRGRRRRGGRGHDRGRRHRRQRGRPGCGRDAVAGLADRARAADRGRRHARAPHRGARGGARGRRPAGEPRRRAAAGGARPRARHHAARAGRRGRPAVATSGAPRPAGPDLARPGRPHDGGRRPPPARRCVLAAEGPVHVRRAAPAPGGYRYAELVAALRGLADRLLLVATVNLAIVGPARHPARRRLGRRRHGRDRPARSRASCSSWRRPSASARSTGRGHRLARDDHRQARRGADRAGRGRLAGRLRPGVQPRAARPRRSSRASPASSSGCWRGSAPASTPPPTAGARRGTTRSAQTIVVVGVGERRPKARSAAATDGAGGLAGPGDAPLLPAAPPRLRAGVSTQSGTSRPGCSATLRRDAGAPRPRHVSCERRPHDARQFRRARPGRRRWDRVRLPDLGAPEGAAS